MQPTFNLVADTICRTAELGLTITDAADAGEFTVISARPIDSCDKCPGCGHTGRLRDHVVRRLTDLPVVGFPTRLQVRVPRFLCLNQSCAQRIYQGELACAESGRTVTRRVTRWILQRLAIDKMSIFATAKALGLGWDLVNDLALDACRHLVYDDPGHLAGVRVLGVDEHVWKHTHRAGEPDSFVTVLVDITPVIDGAGPARLLDMVPGRSAAVLSDWLGQRGQGFRDRVEVVTMDGFAGYATATKQALPRAQAVMDPFHVVHLAADKLTVCRQRLQRMTTGRRGKKNDPLYKNRKTLLTRIDFLTDRQHRRLEQLWATDEDYVALEVTWSVYQQIIAAYQYPKNAEGKLLMRKVISTLRSSTMPKGLEEIKQLGNTLYRRQKDVLAYFDIGASNGPVEAINGRLEHLRGIALGFKNLGHYILRSLIHSGQLHTKINAL